jgi:hypothetical protein
MNVFSPLSDNTTSYAASSENYRGAKKSRLGLPFYSSRLALLDSARFLRLSISNFLSGWHLLADDFFLRLL